MGLEEAARTESERELRREIDRLGALYRLTAAVSHARRLDDVFDEALRCLHTTLHADRSSILLMDAQGAMRFRAWRGLSESYRRVVDGHSPWSADEPEPRPIVVGDVLEAPAMAPYLEAFEDEGIRALAFVPLAYRGELLGKFMVYYADPHDFTDADVDIALNIAQHVAMAVERHRADTELRRAAVVLDAMRDGITVQDAAGAILYVNDAAARLTGFPSAEVMRSVPPAEILERFEVRGADGEPVSMEQLPGPIALLEGRSATSTLRFRPLPDGEERWSHVSATPVQDGDGEPLFAVNVFRDVTAEKLAEAAEHEARREAEEAVRARELLLAVVSHDLRSPLSAISVAAALLADVPEAERSADTIGKAAEQMRRLIEDLLDLARLNAGTLSIRQEPVEVAEMLGQSYRMLSPVAESRGQTLSMVVDEARGAVVSCDRCRILQVLSNLVGNAIKFTPPRGHIELSARLAEGHVEVRVTDDGPGIAPEERERIFDRYWQTDPASRTGVGLGLSIARGIVEAHGGTIGAECPPEGGTAFVFTLPR